ncbi:MAG TPA: hypothetical protein VGH44_01490 [Candidatus Saccharimonadia bacterium]
MSKFRRLLGYLPPALIVGGLGYFVYYSIALYQPASHLACGQSVVARQTDIAVHVVRQWFGKEGQQYQGCQESNL